MTLASADTFTNTGAIHGDVTLGASDTFDMSSGEVTGAITASSGDLLDFSGNFGHETIDNFTAGIGATHDTIQLGAGRLRQLRGALELDVAGRVRRGDQARRDGFDHAQ